ncbi:hypothetical protein GCK72_011240 [Caenorhabditis remanei]|uniref:RING-type domain-containing protein n=1 Tax=Caenorhabditis remanei TaxID=31234 RepID=A0A6A5H784_CAERE|nr:hypothetical protein GCK72_011240 [Caenorhabditis remanei]KAF1762975.1 hypothetical protein GCK72_011240 [Caenorhabditis remanei]
MMIGFAAVFLISMVGKVVSFFLRNTTDTNPLVLVLLILAVYFGFTVVFDFTYYNDCSKCDADFWAIISIIASLHGFLLYYTVIKALELEGYVRFVMIMWQVVFSVSAATSSIDIYIYAKGNIGVHEERKNKKKEEVPLEEVKVVSKPKVEDTVRKPLELTEPTEPRAPAVVTLITERLDSEDSDSAEEDSAEEDTIPYCDTCYDDYSDSRIPRILTKCGHTICEECAKGLLRGNGIRCPYCKNITLVNGLVNSLPKNFALMDIVEREMKKYYVE